TTVLVTHEQDEAFELGDRVAVLRAGRLEQVGTPDELYAEPANLFVARFVGRSGLLPAAVVGPGARGLRVAVEGVEWEMDGRAEHTPGPAVLLVRPEALRLTELMPGTLAATVTGRRFVGPSALFTLMTDGGASIEVVAPPRAVRAGQRVGVMPSRREGGGMRLFPPEAE
ncbi:MAG: TOBE domain-containing protein, partial [Gemmatimonadales bacterium]|nr:TOBE domain-containing protein [Gemmatimonadales bacterium]